MEKIILIGCGQQANVVLYNIAAQAMYKAIGILDNNLSKVGTFLNEIPILSDYSDYSLDKIKTKYEVNKFFISFGNMKKRKEVYNKLVNIGWESINIIHPNAVVSSQAHIGKGVLIEAGCLITPNPVIGNNVVINTGSQINHDNVIQDHVYIASGVILSGGVCIGENTLIDDGVIVCLGKKIGRNCIIGAGSVVTKDVMDNVIAYGNPCRVVRENK